VTGFNIVCDTNSGYGSLGEAFITKLIKDELPKAPIFLFSIKNALKWEGHEN
jgi:hypothetical protein